MTKYVNINIRGGLGDQLFQVATCLSYAWKHNLKPIFLKDEWQERETHPGTYWNSFLVKFNDYLVNSLPQNIMNYHQGESGSVEISSPHELSNAINIRLNGYFQSESHFKDHRDEILKLFKPDDSVINKLNQKYHHLKFEECGILHIRKGKDFTDYYKKAIQLIESKIKEIRWLIISEKQNHQWIQQEFLKDYLITDNDFEYEDLWMTTYFKYVITDNSTLSWWGAWLNTHSDKIIVCPQGLSSYPEGWKVI